jgi:beta-glucosidase
VAKKLMMEETMRSKRFKRSAAALATAAVAFTLAGTLTLQPIASVAASADATSTTSTTDNSTYTYASSYESFSKVLEAGEKLNLELAAEGFVLLKNKDNALPLATSTTSKKKITVLGSASSSKTLAYGGGGSGSQSTPGGGKYGTFEKATVCGSLRDAGYDVNPDVEAIYENLKSKTISVEGSFTSSTTRESGEYMTETSGTGVVSFDGKNYTTLADNTLSSAATSISNYNDAAVIVISRTGSEGSDNPASNVGGHSDSTEHYLELDDAEKQLVAFAKKNFKNIIVLINSPSVMELGSLETDDAIGSILWIGQPGWNGLEAVGKILNGDVNPSGKTVDYYMRDFTQDPTWYNFGDYTQLASKDKYESLGISSSAAVQMNFESESSTKNDAEYAIDYAEGIYMGYRYYETVYAELGGATNADAVKWYNDQTVYPFGYGLSYTTFKQEIKSVKIGKSSTTATEATTITNSNKGDSIYVTVEVQNTGSVAGKDVVELYNTPPYTTGGIDKADVNLVGYAKTAKIEPGQKDTVTIEIAVKDLASFDYNDANTNQFSGYELEAGNYVLSVRSDSHTIKDSKTLTYSGTTSIQWNEDEKTDPDGETPNNIYSQTGKDNSWTQYNTLMDTWLDSTTTSTLSSSEYYLGNKNHYLTRNKLADLVDDKDNLKYLSLLLSNYNSFSEEALNLLNYRVDTGKDGNMYKDYDNPLTTKVETADNLDGYAGNLWVKTADDLKDSSGNALTQGAQGTTTLYDLKGKSYDDPAWDQYLNQFTYNELIETFMAGSHGNQAVESQGKPSLSDLDGPAQLSQGYAWVCEVVIASTWNVDLAYQEGVIVGNESMWQGVNGWYGPAMDIHRNPLAGRNFEYYSQDGIQGGYIAAAVIEGATSTGCHVYAKHAFLNDQETNRFGVATFLTEQALREIYAKSFELAIKKGHANGLMSAFNLIGLSSSVSYATNTQLYTNEWGYDGFTVTDAFIGSAQTGWTSWAMIRGLAMPLGDLTTQGLGAWKTVAKDGVAVDGVYVRGTQGSSKTDTLSYTQWYWVRELAHRALYNNANGSGILNGSSSNGYVATLAKQLFTGTPDIIKQGTEYKDSTAIDLSGLMSEGVVTKLNSLFSYKDIKWELQIDSKALPAGLTFDKTNNKITGKPTVSGTFSIPVTVIGKTKTVESGEDKGTYSFAYISGATTITLRISSNEYDIKTDGVTTLDGTLGTTYNVEIEQEVEKLITADRVTAKLEQNYYYNAVAESAVEGKYTSIKYSATGLPNGLSITQPDKSALTAVISGTPLEVGTFAVTVNVTLAKVKKNENAGGGFGFGGGGMGGGGDMPEGEMPDGMMPGEGGEGGGGGGGSSASVTYTPDDDDAAAELAGGMWVSSSYTTEDCNFAFTVYLTIGTGSDTGAYTITFDNNDGTNTKTNVSFLTSEDAKFTESTRETVGNYATPTRESGYVFVGWQMVSAGPQAGPQAGSTNVISAAEGSTITAALNTALKDVKQDTTLKAVWQEPDVYIKDGVWIVNGVNTGIKVEGQDGSNGKNGADGVSVTGIEQGTSEDSSVTTYVVTLSNGESYTLSIPNGAKGDTGATGATGATGEAGKDAGAGASIASLVIGIVAIVVALGAAGVVVFVLLKKKQ